MMSYSGKDIFEEFEINKSLEDPTKHTQFTLKELSICGMQLVSQLEILHKLGYTHSDIKFQNICYDKKANQYTMIDFALVTKMFDKHGVHKK